MHDQACMNPKINPWQGMDADHHRVFVLWNVLVNIQTGNTTCKIALFKDRDRFFFPQRWLYCIWIKQSHISHTTHRWYRYQIMRCAMWTITCPIRGRSTKFLGGTVLSVDFFDGTDAAFPMIFFENYCSGVVAGGGNEKRLEQQALKITPGVHC